MLKGILKYSIVASLAAWAGRFFIFDIIPAIIPSGIIIAIGTVRFYRKRSTDSKRLLKSVIFFVASALLTWGLFIGLFF